MYKNKSIIALLLIILLLPGCSYLGKKSQNFYFGNYSEAEELFAKGEYEKAIDKYQQYRTENPQGNMAIMAKYYMAKSYQELEQLDMAKQYYNEIIAENPDVVWANFSKNQLEALSEK
jgi:TolA-binding protein